MSGERSARLETVGISVTRTPLTDRSKTSTDVARSGDLATTGCRLPVGLNATKRDDGSPPGSRDDEQIPEEARRATGHDELRQRGTSAPRIRRTRSSRTIEADPATTKANYRWVAQGSGVLCAERLNLSDTRARRPNPTAGLSAPGPNGERSSETEDVATVPSASSIRK
jgi:hypothetical protein